MQDLVLQLTSEQQAVLGVQNATRQPDVDKPARVKGAGFLQSVGVQIQPESLRDCWLQGCAPSAASTNSSGLGPRASVKAVAGCWPSSDSRFVGLAS